MQLAWDWKQILVTVVLTIIGSAVIAYTTLHLQDKMTRKRLLKALLAEVRHNVVVADGQAEWVEKMQGIFAPTQSQKRSGKDTIRDII